MPLPAHLPALILAAALAVSAAEPSASALAVDGTTATGAVRVAAGGTGVGGASGDRLVGVRLPGAVPEWIDQGLVLADGDVLRGTTTAYGPAGLGFTADLLGPIRVPATEVAALRFAPGRVGETHPSGFVGAVLANGDRLSGRLVAVDAGDVAIDTGRRTVSIPRARVALVVMQPRGADAGAARMVVRFANGDRLGGTLGAPSADRWELTTRHGVVRFPAADARGLWREGKGRRWLADLAPGAGSAVVADAALGGGWLRAGGQRWDRGLCCAAPARLEYDVPAAATALVGEVALADGAGSAIFRVLVDGQPAFDSGPVAAGAPAKPFSVALAGRKRLALVVEPGPDVDAHGARAVWGWASLVE